jgi:glycosyltransferase involved in cell wall biosynthesis
VTRPVEGGAPPRVLHLLVNAGETSAPLNEHVLPAPVGRVALCSYFDPKVSLPGHLPAYSAGGRLRGFFRALREASRAGDFAVVHAHSPNVAVQYLLFRPFLGVRPRPAAVITVHTSYPALSLRNLLLLIPALALFDVVVFCSQASRDSFPRPLRALCGRRGRAIPNGVDLARLDRSPAGGTPAPTPPPRILYVGRLIAVKDPLTLVRAFARLDGRDAELDMVGIGPLDRRLRSEAEALGVAGRVRLRGLLPREEVYAAMRQADVFVSTSLGEGLPVAVLEAMACRCPLVLSDIGPHREVVPP